MPQGNQKGTKGSQKEPKGAKRVPKGSPKASQREPKASQRRAKGEPKDDQNAKANLCPKKDIKKGGSRIYFLVDF